jgi:hypothetical protein
MPVDLKVQSTTTQYGEHRAARSWPLMLFVAALAAHTGCAAHARSLNAKLAFPVAMLATVIRQACISMGFGFMRNCWTP